MSQALYKIRLLYQATEVENERRVAEGQALQERKPMAGWQAEKAQFDAANNHPDSVRNRRMLLKAQVETFLGQILDTPTELGAYLHDHGGSRENLVELLENRESRQGRGKAIALTLLARLNRTAALQALDDNFKNQVGVYQVDQLRAAEAQIPEPDRADYRSLVSEGIDPAQGRRREVLRGNAQSLRQSIEPGEARSYPGSDPHSSDGYLQAGEGALHYDLMHAGVPQNVAVTESPLTARAFAGGPLLRENFTSLASGIAEKFRSGKSLATAVLGNGAHWVSLVVDHESRTVTVLDSMQGTGYFSEEEKSQLGAIFKEQVFRGDDPVPVNLVATGQQRDGNNCMIFALLNAHQVAKKANVNAYQEVTAALAGGTLQRYDDALSIGAPGAGGRVNRLAKPPAGYDSSRYRPFMEAFREKTRGLITEWGE